eukprot:gene19211-20625_t
MHALATGDGDGDDDRADHRTPQPPRTPSRQTGHGN